MDNNNTNTTTTETAEETTKTPEYKIPTVSTAHIVIASVVSVSVWGFAIYGAYKFFTDD